MKKEQEGDEGTSECRERLTWERGVPERRPPNSEEAEEGSGSSGGDFKQA